MFTDPLQRRVHIDVELTRPKSPKEQLPMVAVVGIVPRIELPCECLSYG